MALHDKYYNGLLKQHIVTYSENFLNCTKKVHDATEEFKMLLFAFIETDRFESTSVYGCHAINIFLLIIRHIGEFIVTSNLSVFLLFTYIFNRIFRDI